MVYIITCSSLMLHIQNGSLCYTHTISILHTQTCFGNILYGLVTVSVGDLLWHYTFNGCNMIFCSITSANLLFNIIQMVEEACTNLLPNVVCEYLYNLSEIFTRFYTNCKVCFFFLNFPSSNSLLRTFEVVFMANTFFTIHLWLIYHTSVLEISYQCKYKDIG